MLAIVIGPESSGTRWIEETIGRHTKIDRVERRSFPHGPGGEAHWPTLESLDPTRSSPVFVCVRDRSVTKLSQHASGYHSERPEFFDYEQAVERIREQVSDWRGPVVFVSYETMCAFGPTYLRSVLIQADLDPDDFDYSELSIKDGNTRHIDQINKPATRAPSLFKINENPKIVAVLSCPRLGFTGFYRSLFDTLRSLRIEMIYCEGGSWCQQLTAGMQKAMDQGADYILTLDYDSVWETEDVRTLIGHMQSRPDIAALYPVQMCRHYNNIMCPQEGLEYDKPVVEKWAGHFGLTLIRSEAMRHMTKPWFWDIPDSDGEWKNTGDKNSKTDADISFWREMHLRGMKAAVATEVHLGHVELSVLWPCGDRPIVQLIRDYHKFGKPPHAHWDGKSPVGIHEEDLEADVSAAGA
jgi:hypothetical protein